MECNLTQNDLVFLLESLKYAKQNYESASKGHSYSEKQQKSQQFDAVEAKLRALRDAPPTQADRH
jgi:hypothetical protein